MVKMTSIFFSKGDLGKKDDDHKPTKSSTIRSRWAGATSTPTRKRLKRLAIIMALSIFIYLFISNLPTDVPIRDRRRPMYPNAPPGGPRAPGPMPKLKSNKKIQKPVTDASNYPPSGLAVAASDYSGNIFFPKLLPSLQAVSSTTGGHQVSNRNILFAAAGLKSAALLLPMACQMGEELKNYVHFALLGGSEIQMDELRAVNGIDESCQVIFHDHINNYLHPQALLVDASAVEEDYFVSALRKQAPVSGIPLIELPENANFKLAWITKLDSSSLAGTGIVFDLKYSVLQYLYSGPAVTQQWDSRVLGVSLDLPSTHLDGSKPFSAPPGKDTTSEPTPFLWQAPNSNAALFTGQKWIELHALISKLFDFQHASQPIPPFFTEKLVTKRYPSWLEHALKLARARGYWMLYPSEQTARSLTTVHTELYRAPEEYEEELERETPGGNAEFSLSQGAVFETLPGRGKLVPFDDMPLLLWDGTVTELKGLDDAAEEYTNSFRRAVGGCEALAPKELMPRQSMGDLFCLKDV
ncbi:hypothetical protein N0V88_002978 [Collariella sp. IMI 366227]|nr:hypothetical protein N0V88_002978 [Collariella sp. IMI 366227]